MRIWRCPQCEHGHQAPDRLAHLDTRRWCLVCSKRTGRLVERVIPMREAAKERKAAARTAATEARQASRQAEANAVADAKRSALAGTIDEAARASAALDAFLNVHGVIENADSRAREAIRDSIALAMPRYWTLFPRKQGALPYRLVRDHPEWVVFCRFCAKAIQHIGAGGSLTEEVMRPVHRHTNECALRFVAGLLKPKRPKGKN